MKYNNFEKHISKAFVQDSAAVDTDALIASLGIPVAVERKKKIAWWMLAGLVLLSLVVFGLMYVTNAPINNDSLVNNESQAKVSTVVTLDDTSNNISDQNSAPILSMLEEGNENNVAENSTESNESESKNNVVKEKSIVTKEKSNNRFNINSVIAARVVNANDEKEKINQNNRSINPDEYTSVSNINEAKEVYDDEPIVEIENNLSSKRTIVPILEITDRSTSLLLDNEREDIPDPECPSFSYRIPWNIALLAEIGVMKPMKELEYSGADSDSIFTLRELNENSKEAIQLGLHAKISKGSNPLYVRGGIAYTRIAEQMNESYDYTEQDTMRGLVSITTSMSGDTVTAIYGDIISETRFIGRTVKHYFLHLWDLPIAVGYELPVGGSFYVGGEVGAQFNVRTSGSGFIFRDVNDYADLSEVTTKETKVGMSYFGGLHFGKHLNKRSSIQLSARFRYYPSKFSTVDPDVEQRYNLAGLHAGYVWRF